ncbi:MAG TPA: N-acetylmuramoyl-L-alanine amidase, partial [Elusimicrobiota bacterium]|nr:N-acetylmuramoyl-L-alanine amidase [Elusimicrobiota bacterium]
RPVSRRAELRLRGHMISFAYNSPRIAMDGRAGRMAHSTLNNPDGFWVPTSFFASASFFQLTGQRLDWPPPQPKKPASPSRPAGSAAPGVSAPATPVSPTAPKPAAASAPPPAVATAPAAATPLPGASQRAIHRVVIDPGHGGKDPGAVGARGIEEKTLNLKMAQILADALRDRLGYEVLLTRTDDSFIPLEQRAQLANRYNADLFISIHCNASLSSKLRGFEVYFLSEHASDPHADAVARLENASLALEGKGSPSPRQLNALLRSLVKNANINESSALGALIVRGVDKQSSEPSVAVKQAAFYVLRGAEMPAVLIETGFLSNKRDERLLQDDDFQKQLIEGIVSGIDAYDVRKQKERH